MAETTLPHLSSKKKIKSLEEVLGIKKYVLPTSMASDCDADGRPSVMVQINLKKYFVPCGVETDIPEDVFAVMKDAGLVSGNNTYELGGQFDPVRNYDQR